MLQERLASHSYSGGVLAVGSLSFWTLVSRLHMEIHQNQIQNIEQNSHWEDFSHGLPTSTFPACKISLTRYILYHLILHKTAGIQHLSKDQNCASSHLFRCTHCKDKVWRLHFTLKQSVNTGIEKCLHALLSFRSLQRCSFRSQCRPFVCPTQKGLPPPTCTASLLKLHRRPLPINWCSYSPSTRIWSAHYNTKIDPHC